MASIMCGQKLWRALLDPQRKRARRRAAAVDEPTFQNVIFGPWAATVARFDGLDLVVALDAAACLTVVFRFCAREHFRRDFAEALAYALEDLAAPPRIVALESSVIEATPLARLTDRSLSRELEYAQSICDIEVCYHTDLRRVQRNLNELPHGGRELCVPAEAVAALVGRATMEWNPPSH